MTETSGTDRLRIRPYALTGGRVRSTTELPLETIVRVTGRCIIHSHELSSERRDIAGLCDQPVSIVEISARLGLPLGVARVLVGDMVTEGHLNTHHATETAITPDGRPDQRLLERVLNGLQAL